MNALGIPESFWEPVVLSLEVSIAATVIAFAAGLIAAWRMSSASFYGKTLVETAFLLPLVLPPSVVGFILLVVLGKNGWIGRAADALLHLSFVFQPLGAVVAAAVVSFPLIYQTLKSGFQAVDQELKDAARSQGAGEWQVLAYIVLPLAVPFAASGVYSRVRPCARRIWSDHDDRRQHPRPDANDSDRDLFCRRRRNLPLAWALTGCTILLSFGLLLISSRLKSG
ncbi:hypothetical protein HMSSN139_33160 [Paenibacillus sp. HMSSN-139]|nr:hypothetical protein HMSSN139_33160 [Paenibacillus sp. HMSSN-139]